MTNFSSFLVWSDLEKGITYGCDHCGAVNNHLYCALGHLRHGDEQPNITKQPVHPRASLLLTSEKIVFWNYTRDVSSFFGVRDVSPMLILFLSETL